MALLSETLSDAWVSLIWPSAEATIIEEPRRGPPRDKRGHAYSVTMLVQLPDGRAVTGPSLKPLFDEIVPLDALGQRVRREAPQAGDRLRVRFKVSQPERMIPERELLRGLGFALFVHCTVFGVLCRLFYTFLRGEKPRL